MRKELATVVLASVAGLATAPAQAVAQAGSSDYVRVHETVTTSEGVELDGWVWRPKAAGRRPTVLMYSPYKGNFDSGGNSEWPGNRPSLPPELAAFTVVPTQELMADGYAIAFFSIPGTGNSGGCYDAFGRRTATAGADLVDWIARQSWSNKRVGMIGQSGDAGPAWSVATEAPRALGVIVPIQGVVDPYSVVGTPNGLLGWSGAATVFTWNYATHTGPAFNNGPDGDVAAAARGVSRDRLCADTRRWVKTTTLDPAASSRDADFWLERRWSDRFPRIRAAVLSLTGFNDVAVGGFGADAIGWPLLKGRKAMVQAHFPHGVPKTVATGPWIDVVMSWFDYYLREVGDLPEETGRVYYQTDNAAWSTTTSWPPSDARDEVHHLSAEGADATGLLTPGHLTPDPATRDFTLRALTRAGDNYLQVGAEAGPCTTPGATMLFKSPAATVDTTIAGVPFGYLKLSSDEDGGQVGLHVFELGLNFSCDSDPTDFRLISWGAADLRFHRGNFEAKPFRDGTFVKIDMETAGARIEKDHRIGVLLSGGEPFYRAANTYLPKLTLHAGSHVVLPIVGASLGGDAPTMDYPPPANAPRGK